MTGNDNLIGGVLTRVADGCLLVERTPGSFTNSRLSVSVDLPRLTLLEVAASGDCDLAGFDDLDQLTLRLDGSGDVEITN